MVYIRIVAQGVPRFLLPCDDRKPTFSLRKLVHAGMDDTGVMVMPSQVNSACLSPL